MANTTLPNKKFINQLIMYPAIITLVITLLRLTGELLHGPAFLFNRSPGGGFAIIGISWLPIIFGPYFAVRLFDRNLGPSSFGKTIGFALLGFVLMGVGGVLTFSAVVSFPGRTLVGLALIVIAAALQYVPWRALAQTLIAYAYLARVPVVIVMFFAMRGNWHTHYDNVLPPFDKLAFWPKFMYLAVAPQLVMWIAFTMTVGALCGAIYGAIVRRK
jgi:hypothetical protein